MLKDSGKGSANVTDGWMTQTLGSMTQSMGVNEPMAQSVISVTKEIEEIEEQEAGNA